MKVRSALLTEMSGKIGGAVASRARGGVQYFRKLVTPSNPRSFLQTAMRSGVTSASAAWRSILTEEQQQAWWDLADEIGTTATGKTLFSKVNQPRYYANNNERLTLPDGSAADPLSIFTSPPTSLSLVGGVVSGLVIDASANTLAITAIAPGPWNADANAPNPSAVYIFASPGQPASRFSRSHPYQQIAAFRVEESADIAPDPIDLAALDLPTVAGYVMYVKYYFQDNTGALSTPVEQRVTIVP